MGKPLRNWHHYQDTTTGIRLEESEQDSLPIAPNKWLTRPAWYVVCILYSMTYAIIGREIIPVLFSNLLPLGELCYRIGPIIFVVIAMIVSAYLERYVILRETGFPKTYDQTIIS